MFAKAIEELEQSVFPIIAKINLVNNLQVIAVVGTGFFLDNEGLFTTANHVINDNPPRTEFLYIGCLPKHIVQPVKIEQIHSDPAKDVFLGRVQKDYGVAVPVSRTRPPVGRSVCLCGYPLPRIGSNPDGSINVRNVRRYYQPTCVIDFMEITSGERQYDSFITQHTSLKGMSGGPVFGTNGHVYGMDVATWTRKIEEDKDHSFEVRNGVVKNIDIIMELAARSDS